MKAISIGLIAFLLLSCSTTSTTSVETIAWDLSKLYDEPTLEGWRNDHKGSTTKILDEVIWPALMSNEKRDLKLKPILEFPLWADGELHNNPLAFYAPASNDRIIVPAFSLKFLDDLCTAYAWLQVNGYSPETIWEYTAILKYGVPPSGGFPPPLVALHIPMNAHANQKVDNLAVGHSVTARTFILLHEMGHILRHHEAHSFAESVRNEQEADAFAAAVMQRTPLSPLGILLFFLADAHWTNFPAGENDTHPVSGKRVSALAEHIDNPSLAKQLRDLGALLDDSDIRAGFVATGKAGNLTALAPRRPGELPRQQTGLTQKGHIASFDGIYQGQFIKFHKSDPSDSLPLALVLERRNEGVKGSLSFGLGFFTIVGTIVDERLYFDWEWASNYGKGVLEDRGNGEITGTWGYREARSGAGTLSGQRTTESR